MSHSNVAIFVPHNGCPHMCSFCNQKQITGQSFQPKAEDVVEAAKTAEASLGEKTKEAEIAFFGGSFTAIDREYMLSLLKAAYPFVKSGKFKGIRISTRPDYIDEEILTLLKKYGVSAIELGAQSMDEEVLAANNRGHKASAVVRASELIKSFGFELGLQMMTGLYKSTVKKDIYTANELIKLHPETVRIYPTVVMRNTQLAELFESGEYVPYTLQTSVELCAELLKMFETNNIKVIRLGLHYSDSLLRDSIAGNYHPAFRELCESRIILSNIIDELKLQNFGNGRYEVYVNDKAISKAVGQKKSNIEKLSKLGYEVRIVKATDLDGYSVRIQKVDEV